MNADDLKLSRIERQPVRSSFGVTILSAPPPRRAVSTSPNPEIARALSDRGNGAQQCGLSAPSIESMKLAYADRSEYLGDLIEQRSLSKHLQVTLTSTGAVPLFKTTWPHL